MYTGRFPIVAQHSSDQLQRDGRASRSCSTCLEPMLAVIRRKHSCMSDGFHDVSSLQLCDQLAWPPICVPAVGLSLSTHNNAYVEEYISYCHFHFIYLLQKKIVRMRLGSLWHNRKPLSFICSSDPQSHLHHERLWMRHGGIEPTPCRAYRCSSKASSSRT